MSVIYPETYKNTIAWRCLYGKIAHVYDVETREFVCGTRFSDEHAYYVKNGSEAASRHCKTCTKRLERNAVIILSIEEHLKNTIRRMNSNEPQEEAFPQS